MADNPPQPTPQPPKANPPLPSSGLTGRLKSPTTHLPGSKKAVGTGKIVVMLSSVAKAPPAVTQSIPMVAPPLKPPTNLASTNSAQIVRQPPPLPPKQVTPAASPLPMSPGTRLSSTTFVKLPPKTTVPALISVVPKEAQPEKNAAPLLPAKRAEPIAGTPKKTAQHIPPIKLNEPASDAATPAESIFLQANKPEAKPDAAAKPPGWKSLEPGELNPPAGDLKSLDVFARSQKIGDSPATPVPETKPVPTPVAPPMLAKEPVAEPKPALNPAPVTLASAHPVQVAPPMLEKETAPEPPQEKLPQPHLPFEAKKGEAAEPEGLHKAPPMIPAEAPAPAKPLLPPTSPVSKLIDERKKSAPIVLTPTSPKNPGIAEARPALRPAVLPKRAVPPPKEPETESVSVPPPVEAKKVDPVAEPAIKPDLKPEEKKEAAITAPPVETPKAVAKPDEKKEATAAVAAATTSAVAINLMSKKSEEKAASKTSSKLEPAPTTPPAAAQSPVLPVIEESATKRRSGGIPFIWVLLVLIAIVAFCIFYFGRSTPAVGQSAPSVQAPSGHEGWIVLAAAVAAVVLAIGVMRKLKPAATTVELAADPVPAAEVKRPALPPTRTERAKRRRLTSVLVFWLLLVPLTGVGLVLGSFYFGRDTRVEGQVIPPAGMTVNNEVWVVSDFRDLASGIAEDLAAERMPLMQEIQERREHVQRAQADVALREERIRLIQDEIQAAKDEITSLVKQSRDATQHVWDGEGAQIDGEYESKLSSLKNAIGDRAKSLNLKYTTDDTYPSPEVWANAYRLALYDVPKGVDAVKEHQWLGDQMKAWRDFQKSLDDRKQALREKAAQLKLAPAPRITDLNTRIDDLNQRIDATTSEEAPLKTELQEAQMALAQAQAADQGLDDKYYKQLYALPVENITKHITVAPNGRFTWVEDETFAEGENERKYWIFSRATRADGRQYWALGRVSIQKNHKLCLLIDPESFISTKAILRPNLSPEEQEQ